MERGTVKAKRLPRNEELIVLGEMERFLEENALCFRQDGDLVFPSHCGRERPEAPLTTEPSLISFRVSGYLDEIYATLVVNLTNCKSFELKNLWRNAADFCTLAEGYQMSVTLSREEFGSGEIRLYFNDKASDGDRVAFYRYVDAHLKTRASSEVTRLRNYKCSACGELKVSSDAMRKRLDRDKERAEVGCDNCDARIPLWDRIESLYADRLLPQRTSQMQAETSQQALMQQRLRTLALQVKSMSPDKCRDVTFNNIDLEFDAPSTDRRSYLHLEVSLSAAQLSVSSRAPPAERDKYATQIVILGIFSTEATGVSAGDLVSVHWKFVSQSSCEIGPSAPTLSKDTLSEFLAEIDEEASRSYWPAEWANICSNLIRQLPPEALEPLHSTSKERPQCRTFSLTVTRREYSLGPRLRETSRPFAKRSSPTTNTAP